jgi:hypothetical protein
MYDYTDDQQGNRTLSVERAFTASAVDKIFIFVVAISLPPPPAAIQYTLVGWSLVSIPRSAGDLYA